VRLAELIKAGRPLPALAAVAAAAGTAAAQPTVQLQPGEALISIEAEGVSRARPDIMTMSAGTVTTGTTAADAVAANNALTQRLIDVVRAHGIAPRDVRTTDFGVQPRFEGDRGEVDSNGRPPRIIGYVAENRFDVRLRDLGSAQGLISRLFEAGANSVSGPIFGLSNEIPERRAAERDAIAQALAEADNYAAAAGRRVGRLLRISDRRTWVEREDETLYVTGSRIMPTPIEPGEVETRATVYVDFALAPQ
jgi:uncharacterized protein